MHSETSSSVAIPPRRYGDLLKKRNQDSITGHMRRLEIGGCLEFPRVRENALRACARAAGIKITQRRMGTRDKIFVWRVA
jgi:hypothetical protein